MPYILWGKSFDETLDEPFDEPLDETLDVDELRVTSYDYDYDST